MKKLFVIYYTILCLALTTALMYLKQLDYCERQAYLREFPSMHHYQSTPLKRPFLITYRYGQVGFLGCSNADGTAKITKLILEPGWFRYTYEIAKQALSTPSEDK